MPWLYSRCLYCAEPVHFVTGLGWLHLDGAAYRGECYCLQPQPHVYSHNELGELLCPTWRDEHRATPIRS